MPVGPDVAFQFWWDGEVNVKAKFVIKDKRGLTEDQWERLTKAVQDLIWTHERYDTKDTTGEPG